ncbi:DUF6153 family protein [Nocardia farcinica]|uniref:Uncharacterized protein n=1 Tax=Nocardia farcinica (strain IFM 10152) TaxID=247156 RepID=Q5YMI8_NOCFA|nr:DUF6153 family protein [Nocardia farcinica]BAD60603.1 hypothetical protein PNF1_780 [Nocardia farcinica IFM 10152]
MQHQSSRASRSVRVLGLLVLLLGITVMHTGGFHLGSDAHHAGSSPASITAGTTLHDEVTIGGGGHGLGHDAVHACVFILSTLTLAIGLVLLYRAGHLSRGIGPMPTTASLRLHRERPPPWVVPSLAELSILRI